MRPTQAAIEAVGARLLSPRGRARVLIPCGYISLGAVSVGSWLAFFVAQVQGAGIASASALPTCHVVRSLQGSLSLGLLHVIIIVALTYAFLAVYFGDAGTRLRCASLLCDLALCKLSPTLSSCCHQAPWTPTAPSGRICGRSFLPGQWLSRTSHRVCPQQEAKALAGLPPFAACCPMWRRKRRRTGRGSETSGGCWPRFLLPLKRMMKFSHLM